MAYHLQSYGQGYIQRDGEKYEYVVNGEVVGTYKTVATLVQHNPVSDGKQAPKVAEAEDTKTNVDSTAAKEDKTTKKKSATKK